MSRAWLLALMLLLQSGLAAADAKPAIERLRQAAEQAEAELASERASIESARQNLLAELDAAQVRLRSAEAELEGELRQLNQARQSLARQQDAGHRDQKNSTALARRLAGEGLGVDPRSSAESLLEAWPDVEAAVAARLNGLAQGLRPRLESVELLDRDGHPLTVRTWHWGAAQRVALGETASARGLCLRLDDGRWQIAGPALPNLAGELRPIDITNRLASTPLTDSGAMALMRRAGPFAWPILALALLGALIIGDRLWLLWRWRMPRDLVDRLIADLDNPSATAAHLRRGRAPSTRILRELVAAPSGDELAVQEMSGRAGAALVEAEMRLQRGLRLLAVLAAAAPLLGLLGTVTGMITSFQALDLGGGGNAGQLSAGIGEALLTTEFGLIVAVPLLLAHAIFARDAQRRRSQAESAAMRLLAAQQGRLGTSLSQDSSQYSAEDSAEDSALEAREPHRA